MLLAGRGEELKWNVLTGARKYQPDGIVNAADCWDRYKESKDTESYAYPDTMPELNAMTYGARPGSIVTITSGTGMGKTSLMRELKYHYYLTTDMKIADIALEEDVGDTIAGLLSLHLNKRLTLPDVEVEDDEEQKGFQYLFNSGRFTLYDFFGGMDDDSLFSKLRYFAATGHKLIFLDHLSIIVSEYASEGGERERIDTIMTKLAKFVKETGVILFLVVHLKKSSNLNSSFEEGAQPTLDDLRGSATIKQLSWDVLGISRNQQHPDKACADISELTVLKCRFTGRTGTADFLRYDHRTGRMLTTDMPPNYRSKR
jgi:twinkle protein